MRRYIIAPKAGEDLKEIRAYLKREAGLRVAQSTLKKIKDAIVFLSRNPGRLATLLVGKVSRTMIMRPVALYLTQGGFL